MISEKMDCLFTPKSRKILMFTSVLIGIMCFLLVRYSQEDFLKIAWLYVMYACIMFLVVLYKNSLNKYEITIFLFLGIQLLAVVPNPDNLRAATISITYLLSYRYGVSSRSFVATIIDFFTGRGFISRYFVWHFVFSSTIFISFTMSAFLGTLIKNAKDSIKCFLLFLSLLWLSSFTAISAYFHYINFGRIEIFAIPVLFFIMLIIKKKIIQWLIPLLALIIMAIHLNLVFFYIPLVVILLLYKIFEKTENRRQSIFLLIATIKAVLIAFLCYILLRERTFVFDDAYAFFLYLSAKTDLSFSVDSIHFLMFASLEDHLIGWRDRMSFQFIGNLSIIINIPLVLLFVVFWVKCFIWEKQKTMKLFFLMPIFVLLYNAIAFFLFWDFARWMIMIINVQFFLVFFLVSSKNKTVLSVLETITPFIRRNIFFVVLACLLMAFLGPVRNIGPSEEVTNIFSVIMHLVR